MQLILQRAVKLPSPTSTNSVDSEGPGTRATQSVLTGFGASSEWFAFCLYPTAMSLKFQLLDQNPDQWARHQQAQRQNRGGTGG